MVCSSGSKRARAGLLTISCLTESKLCCAVTDQEKVDGLCSHSLWGSTTHAELGMNFAYHDVSPRKERTLCTSFGRGTADSATTWAGSGFSPVCDTTCPKNDSSVCRKWHFERFSFSPAASMHCSTALRCLSCTSGVPPKTITSSR